MGSSFSSCPAVQMKRNAPTTSGAAEAGIGAGISSELMSNSDAIETSPRSEGLGTGVVVGGGGAAVDGPLGVETPVAAWEEYSFETLHPGIRANRISGASAFVRVFKMLVTPTGLYLVART